MAWQVAKGLEAFRDKVNRRWQNRDKKSDGTIGDTAHQSRTSGHNPDDTPGSEPSWDGDSDTLQEVRAWDMDKDLGEPGTTAQMLVDHLIKLPGLSKIIRYIIFNRKMYHSRDNFAPTPYEGDNPHTEHVHFESAWTQEADNNTTFDFKLEEVGDMALDSADAQKVWETDGCVTMPDWHPSKASNPEISAGYAMWIALDEAHDANVKAGQASAKADSISSRLLAIETKLNTIASGVAAENAERVPTPEEYAAAVVAALPQGADQISQEEVTVAVREAFAGAFGSTA